MPPELTPSDARLREVVIEPPRGYLSVDWKEVWRYRSLFWVLAWRDIAVRYKQTILGVLWAVLQPLITMVVFTVIFNRLAKIDSGDGTPYPVFLYVGLILWQFYSATLSNAANSITGNAALIQKVYFPRLIIPATAVMTGLVDMAISAAVLAILMACYHFAPHVNGLLILPWLVVTATLSSMGAGLVLAALNVKYRDIRHALPFVIQILMYVTPVIYPVRFLDPYPIVKHLSLWLNPISGTIAVARESLLSPGQVDPYLVVSTTLATIMLFVCGIVFFRQAEKDFADVM